jgi:hypothetical protein
MTDIVERLRKDAATWNANSQTGDMMLEAAEVIERLRQELNGWKFTASFREAVIKRLATDSSSIPEKP